MTPGTILHLRHLVDLPGHDPSRGRQRPPPESGSHGRGDRRIAAVQRRLFRELGREPTPEELAAELARAQAGRLPRAR